MIGSMQAPRTPPMVCFVGPSGVGKTTLVAQVIQHLSDRGLRVGALKHASHSFQMDRRGKDTHRFRVSGARAIAIASPTERALITTTERRTTLLELAATLPDNLDFIVAEGWKSEGAPKVEVHRGDAPLLSYGGELEGLIAIATDRPGAHEVAIPQFSLEDVAQLCEYILATVVVQAVESPQCAS